MFVRRTVHTGLAAAMGLASILLWAALGALAGPPGPQAPAPTTIVTSQITYQGRLLWRRRRLKRLCDGMGGNRS